MSDFISSFLLVVGGFVMLLAGIGMLRMPDLFARLQATTKAATLGIGCILMGTAVHFNSLGITTRAVLITAFVFLTTPISAHVIAHAAYSIGVPFWEGTVVDELQKLKVADTPPVKRAESELTDPSDAPPEQA